MCGGPLLVGPLIVGLQLYYPLVVPVCSTVLGQRGLPPHVHLVHPVLAQEGHLQESHVALDTSTLQLLPRLSVTHLKVTVEVCPLVSQEPSHYVKTVLVPATGLAGAPVKPL